VTGRWRREGKGEEVSGNGSKRRLFLISPGEKKIRKGCGRGEGEKKKREERTSCIFDDHSAKEGG